MVAEAAFGVGAAVSGGKKVLRYATLLEGVYEGSAPFGFTAIPQPMLVDGGFDGLERLGAFDMGFCSAWFARLIWCFGGEQQEKCVLAFSNSPCVEFLAHWTKKHCVLFN